MCQLCHISTITSAGRWPNPMTSAVNDVCFLATICHDQHTAYQAKSRSSPKNSPSRTTTNSTAPKTAPKALLSNAILLVTAVKDLEELRQDWWKGKTGMLRKLQESCEEGDAKKVTEIHKINNAAIGRIESVEARVGGFVKWGLGIDGSVEALLEMDLEGVEGEKGEGESEGKGDEAKEDELAEMVRGMALSG